MTIWLRRKIYWMINYRWRLKPSLTINARFLMMNCYSWGGRKGNVSDYIEKPEALIWKRILIWLPKFISISFLKKGHCLSAMSCTGNVHIKSMRYWKLYLAKRSRYCKNVKIRKVLLQILINFLFQRLGILLHQFRQLNVQRSSRWQINSFAPSLCYPWAIWRSYLRLQRLVHQRLIGFRWGF